LGGLGLIVLVSLFELPVDKQAERGCPAENCEERVGLLLVSQMAARL